MEKVVEVFFDHVLKEFCGEGERRIKLQAFSACLVTVLGVRRLLILVFSFCFACFLSALSLFGALFAAVDAWSAGRLSWLDPKLDLCLGVCLLSTGMLVSAVREKKWAAAFGLQERIDTLEREASSGGISEEQIVRLIERVLEERSKKQDAPPSPPNTDQAA